MTRFSPGWHPGQQDINCKVVEIARHVGVHVYLVGGYVRDALLGRYSTDFLPRDYDYAVKDGGAVSLARLIADQLNGHFVLLDESCDTARVVFDDGVMLDFAGCVGGDIESDLKRRDFTINALAWDPESPEQVIDLFDGKQDLDKRLVRAIAEENFADDPLRVLRGYRFAAVLAGEIDNQTKEMIRRHTGKLSAVAAERISYELFRIFESARCAKLIADMGEIGLLEVIFPELSATREVTPNAFHHLDLWQHSLELVAQSETKVTCLPAWALNSLRQPLSPDVSRLAATKLACLLHDIGKPGTWAITPEGRHTFYAHDSLGAEMAEVIVDRLRWSKAVGRFVTKLIRWHLRPGALFHQGPPTRKAIHRFYRQIGCDVPELILLALADLGATCGAGLEEEKRQILEKNLLELLDGYLVFKDSQQAMVRLLDGNRIMQLLNVTPGPVLGELMEALQEAQGLGEVTNVADAQQFILDTYRTKYPQ